MDEIRRIARIYFQEFEGLHLYPSCKAKLFYGWIFALITMIFVNALFIYLLVTNSVPLWCMIFPIASDALAGILSKRVSCFREHRIKELMNRRVGYSFESVDSCKRDRLATLFGTRPEKFLDAATEINCMKDILISYDKTSQESTFDSVIRSIYDSRSKDRLMNLGLVIAGVVVTLAATNQANLENLFDAFSNDGFLTFIAILELLAVSCFLLWLMLISLLMPIRNTFNQWRAKLSKDIRGGETEISYLVRDLVRLHRRRPLILGQQDFPNTSQSVIK